MSNGWSLKNSYPQAQRKNSIWINSGLQIDMKAIFQVEEVLVKFGITKLEV